MTPPPSSAGDVHPPPSATPGKSSPHCSVQTSSYDDADGGVSHFPLAVDPTNMGQAGGVDSHHHHHHHCHHYHHYHHQQQQQQQRHQLLPPYLPREGPGCSLNVNAANNSGTINVTLPMTSCRHGPFRGSPSYGAPVSGSAPPHSRSFSSAICARGIQDSGRMPPPPAPKPQSGSYNYRGRANCESLSGTVRGGVQHLSSPTLFRDRTPSSSNAFDSAASVCMARSKPRSGDPLSRTLNQTMEASAITLGADPSRLCGNSTSHVEESREHRGENAPLPRSEGYSSSEGYRRTVLHEHHIRVKEEDKERKRELEQEEAKLDSAMFDSFMGIDEDGMVTVDEPWMHAGSGEEREAKQRSADLVLNREDVAEVAPESWTLGAPGSALRKEKASVAAADEADLLTGSSSGADRDAPCDLAGRNVTHGTAADDELKAMPKTPQPQQQASTPSEAESPLIFAGPLPCAAPVDEEFTSNQEAVHSAEDVDSDCQEITQENFWEDRCSSDTAARQQSSDVACTKSDGSLAGLPTIAEAVQFAKQQGKYWEDPQDYNDNQGWANEVCRRQEEKESEEKKEQCAKEGPSATKRKAPEAASGPWARARATRKPSGRSANGCSLPPATARTSSSSSSSSSSALIEEPKPKRRKRLTEAEKLDPWWKWKNYRDRDEEDGDEECEGEEGRDEEDESD